MRKTIQISKFASGSKTDSIGDTTLFYTAEYSRHASDISGIFLDNPPVLSPKHASLVWRYYQDEDLYTLMHVQGSHVVSSSLGRIYPFRAAYEVSRDDMNAIGFHLASLFNVMPRITGMPNNRVESATEVDVQSAPYSPSGQTLAGHIKQALYQSRPLFIGLSIPDNTYREDGIFSSPELHILLAAIESLPLHLRRYATFGFMVDDHFSYVLEDVPIVVYDQSRPITIPENAISLSWEQSLSGMPSLSVREEQELDTIHLPGEHNKLLRPKELRRVFEVNTKEMSQLRGDDWPIWLSLGHSLKEMTTGNWKQFQQAYDQMDETTRAAYADMQREASLSWPLDDLDERMVQMMDYSEADLFTLQRKALKDYLRNERYGFLFKNGLTDDHKQLLDKSFLNSLQLNSRRDTERWYKIFKSHGREKDPDVVKAFRDLYAQYVVPSLTSMEDIVLYMQTRPFIPAKAFRKPAKIYQPKEMGKLKDSYQELINQWLQEAVDAHSFTDIEQVLEVMADVVKTPKDVQSIARISLREIKRSALFSLLTRSSQKDDVLYYSERLMSKALDMPRSWEGFAKEKVLPVVKSALFGNKQIPDYHPPYSEQDLRDVGNWPGICQMRSRFPIVYKLTEREVAYLAEHDTRHGIYKNLKEKFVTVSSLRKEEKARKDESTDGAKAKKAPVYTYKGKAQEASPLIHTYITILKKTNKDMGKEMERLFKDLKRSKNLKKRSRLNLLWGLLSGIVLCVAVYTGYRLFLKPEAAKPEGYHLALRLADDKNLMVQLAEMNLSGLTVRVSLDTLDREIQMDKTANLVGLSDEYYKRIPESALAKALVYSVEADSETPSKNDTLEVSNDMPLLSQVCDKPYRISNLLIGDSVRIDIPNQDLFADDDQPLTTLDTRYYFEVVRAIERRRPKGIQIAY